MLFDIGKPGLKIRPGHDQPAAADTAQVAFIKILFPVKGDITPLHDQVLAVFDGGLHHLPHNGPEVIRQGIIIEHRQGCISASDQAHFQMVHGKIGVMVRFKEPLGQERLSRVGRAGDQDDHEITLSAFLFILSHSEATVNPGAKTGGPLAAQQI